MMAAQTVPDNVDSLVRPPGAARRGICNNRSLLLLAVIAKPQVRLRKRGRALAR